MTVYAITDTKKGRTVIAPTYLQTTHFYFFIFIISFFIYTLSPCGFRRYSAITGTNRYS